MENIYDIIVKNIFIIDKYSGYIIEGGIKLWWVLSLWRLILIFHAIRMATFYLICVFVVSLIISKSLYKVYEKVF